MQLGDIVRGAGDEGGGRELVELDAGEAFDFAKEIVAQIAANARRNALLEALGGLGYEVTEGMATAWASEGRLVLRSAARPDYGVEVSGAERIQMRPVAFDAGAVGPDPARDIDAETIWCGDVTRLQQNLARHGDALKIEKALPVGAVPLKRVATAGTAQNPGIKAPVRQERTLR